MLSERAASYIVHQHLSHGKELKDVALKWRRTYKDEAFTTSLAREFLVEYERILGSGCGWPIAMDAARRGLKPKLAVVSAPKKVAKKK